MRKRCFQKQISEFRRRVYNVVRTIPRGKTMTYSEVARAVGRPAAARAVGNALNKNHDRKIPCHRVIRSNGEVGGYNRGRDRKLSLLITEGVSVKIKMQKSKWTPNELLRNSTGQAM